jgi:enoyl-CoA hydratase/carnithine racemase
MAHVETALSGGVLTVTLADEERRNVLSTELMGELVPALDEADADPSVRVVVLTNRGRVFCAGADLTARSRPDAPVAPTTPTDLFGRFRRSPKPYVGRIAGHCVAGAWAWPPRSTSASPSTRHCSASPRSGSGWPRP